MNGGVLGKILSKLGADYGDDAARQIIGQYGDDITKRGANSFLSRAVDGAELPPTMLAYHGLPAEKLKMAAQVDDYLVNPSIQTVDPTKNMGGDFGEIVLLANKDLVNPNKRAVSTFNRDIYSPRFPEVDPEGMIAGTKQWASADNLSRYMNKQGTKAAESGFRGLHPGSVAARKAKKFTSIRDMVENQQQIRPYDEVHGALDKYSDDLAGAVGNMADSDTSGSFYGWQNAEEDMLDMLKGKQAFNARTPEQYAAVNSLAERAKTLPTDYFETKVTRPVKISEFSGALLPEGFDDAKVLEMLKRNNIRTIRNYDPKAYSNNMNQNESLRQSLADLAKENRFTTPYLLGGAGALPILGGLLGSSNQENI